MNNKRHAQIPHDTIRINTIGNKFWSYTVPPQSDGIRYKKPRNYLIVRGLSRIFRFSSEVHSGAGGTCP